MSRGWCPIDACLNDSIVAINPHLAGKSFGSYDVRISVMAALAMPSCTTENTPEVKRRSLSFLRVLALAALVTSSTLAAGAQNAVSAPQAPDSTSETAPPENDTTHCQGIAAGHPEMTPLVKLCRFALTFRRQLPDFVCEQTTNSIGRRGATVMSAEVTFENGHEHYSNVTIDGKPPSAKSLRAMKFISTGELGSDLIDLFRAPIVAEFKVGKEGTLHKTSAYVYEFHLAAEQNIYWKLQDTRGVILHPEYLGELWLERETGRLLRMKMRPVNMPSDFDITSTTLTIDYNYIPIANAGRFLLPSRSETIACFYYAGPGGSFCRPNVILFHHCRKFTATTRIIIDQPEH
jgi:hypothetical protein